MKNIKIIIDDKEYMAQLSDEQVENLTKSNCTRTGYERVIAGQSYYAHNTTIINALNFDNNSVDDAEKFAKGDYVNDEQLYNDRERARVLHDRMEQWQALNDEPVDWGNNNKPKFEIKFYYQQNKLKVDCEYVYRSVEAVYFSTYKKAEEAIDVFRDELMWYYTEYRSRLDEKRTEVRE